MSESYDKAKKVMKSYLDNFIQDKFWSDFRTDFRLALYHSLTTPEKYQINNILSFSIEWSILFDVITPIFTLIGDHYNSHFKTSMGLQVSISLEIETKLQTLFKFPLQPNEDNFGIDYENMTEHQKLNYECDNISRFIRKNIGGWIDKYIVWIESKIGVKESIVILAPPSINTAKPISKPYKQLYLLMNEFEMFEGEKYQALTNIKKAKLLSLIFGLESEGIRQDLSKVNDFMDEGNNKIEFERLVHEVNTAKAKKGRK